MPADNSDWELVGQAPAAVASPPPALPAVSDPGLALHLDPSDPLHRLGAGGPRIDPRYIEKPEDKGKIGRAFSIAGKTVLGGAADFLNELTGVEARNRMYREEGLPEEKSNLSTILPSAPGETSFKNPPKLPIEETTATLPTWERVPLSAGQGLIKSTPQLAAVTAAQAAGVPTPIAAAAVFGQTETGFDPKQAAIAAALPFIGKYTGELSGVLARRFGISNEAAIKLIRGAGATIGPAAPLIVEGERDIAKLPEDQRKNARIEMYSNILGQAALGPMGLEPEKGAPNASGKPSAASEAQREIRTPVGEGAPLRQPGEAPGARPPQREEAAPVQKAAEQLQPEKIIAAASKHGESGQMFAGFNHPASMESAISQGAIPEVRTMDQFDALPEQKQAELYNKFEQGFLTNKGRFVSREEAAQIGQKANQLWRAPSQERGGLDADDLDFSREPQQPLSQAKSAARDILKVQGMSGEEFVQFMKGKKPTVESYSLAKTIPTQAIRFLESARDKMDARMQDFIRKSDTVGVTDKEEAEMVGIGAKSQYFNEAIKFRRALDEAQKLENPTMQKLAEIERRQAVGDFTGKELSEALGKKGGETVEKEIPKEEGEAVLTAGPGAAVPEDVGAKPQLAQLTDTLRTLAEQQAKQKTPFKQVLVNEAYNVGKRLSEYKDTASKAVSGLKSAAKLATQTLRNPPKATDHKAAVGARQLALGESVMNARDYVENATKAVPNALDQEAISNWIDNGGDRRSILRALAETDPKYEKGYERALRLTPEQETIARNEQNYFESRLAEAQQAGILEDGIENYIHRMYEKDTPWKNGAIAEIQSGVFTGKPGLARQRIFQYDYEAEKAGYKPIKSFIQRTAAYDLALNKAIADRALVKAEVERSMPDGKKAIEFGGFGTKVGGVGTDSARLIKSTIPFGKIPQTADGRTYIPYDHPALRKWVWATETEEGAPVLVQGNAYVHPDAVGEINSLFGKSWFQKHALTRGALAVSGTIKNTMLDLSGFHPVQITLHGWEHRADVPLTRWTAKMTGRTFKPIDLQDPVQRELVSHGLNVVDHNGHQMFSEGLSGGTRSLLSHIPVLGPRLVQYNRWLFEDYIPRLKMEMATHALERNRKAYSKDLASGKMSEDQLHYLTAEQANAAFGELNYEMMGRNKTTQDFLRLSLLAPDFLEARGRFVGQAAKTAVGGYGREQLIALGLGAATLYLTARILNKQLSGQYHFEPDHAFDVVYNGRAYSLRTVQGDILHAMFNPRSFAYTRLNPVTTRTLFEMGTGRDQFGRPRSAVEQIQDFMKTVVPISAKGALNKEEQKWWEGLINAFGVTERRSTAMDNIYKLADDFKKKRNISEPGEFIYDPQKDPYRGVKLALRFDTPAKAAQEIKLALDSGKTDWQHLSTYFDNFGKRPFVGNKTNEALFWQSLSEDQKKTYQNALAERAKMRENAREAFRILREEKP
jgi:hypothetical protein